MNENHLVLLLEHLLQTQAVVSLVVDVYEFNEFRGFFSARFHKKPSAL